LLALFIAVISLNMIDAVMTRTALRRGHQERMRFTKKLIKELGLDKAMVLKSLVPVTLVILAILGWDNAVIGLGVSIIFMVPVLICYLYAVTYNCIQLLKIHH
jgi:4-hydroxybenzoate polyprenyltransferase